MDNISQLRFSEIKEVMTLLKAIIAEMNKNGIDQWDAIYPDAKTIEEDIISETLFGLREQDELVGILVLNKDQPEEYLTINWQYQKPLIMHRLGVHPKYQNKGMAQYLMQFVQKFARENSYESIRLDAFTQNPGAVKLYRKLGFAERGKVNFRKGEFYVFEKNLAY